MFFTYQLCVHIVNCECLKPQAHLDLRLWGERERDLRLSLSRDRDLSRSLRLLSRSREVERERRLSGMTDHKVITKSLKQNKYF